MARGGQIRRIPTIGAAGPTAIDEQAIDERAGDERAGARASRLTLCTVSIPTRDCLPASFRPCCAPAQAAAFSVATWL